MIRSHRRSLDRIRCLFAGHVRAPLSLPGGSRLVFAGPWSEVRSMTSPRSLPVAIPPSTSTPVGDVVTQHELPDFHPETGHLHTCNGVGPCGCAAALYCVAQDAEAMLTGLDVAVMARAFSLWLDGSYPPDLDPETRMRRRVLKVCEESGEVHEAVGAFWGENPRKPRGPIEDVLKELADCAGAALGAIEHLTGHRGSSLRIVSERVREVCERVGVRWACSDCGAPLHDADESRTSGLCLWCLNGPLPAAGGAS